MLANIFLILYRARRGNWPREEDIHFSLVYARSYEWECTS
jgi:hypothetical protein